MGSLGPFELVLIFLAILLIFGAKRIPEIARGLGKGIKEFKSATREISNEFNVDESSNRIDPPRQAPHSTPRQGGTSEKEAPSRQESVPNGERDR